MGSSQVIPLFPLNTVLFPGMVLSLHIFEERYKKMLSDCQDGSGYFGVALIRDGEEVGSTAEPYRIGTLAAIRQSVPIQGGHRFYLQTQGTARFRVVRLLHERPYLQGEIELLEDHLAVPGTARTESLVADSLAKYQQYLDMVRKLGGTISDFDSTPDPEFLSWAIAATLVVAPSVRQQLLEIDGTLERLEREIEILGEVVETLRSHSEKTGATAASRRLPFSMN